MWEKKIVPVRTVNLPIVPRAILLIYFVCRWAPNAVCTNESGVHSSVVTLIESK